MFISFVEALRRGGIPASLKEHLLLLEALDADVITSDPEQFYYLARATFVHDESQLDRFDRVFAEVFKGLVGGPGRQGRAIKVWEKREYRDLDGERELGTRNIKVALRRLRRFAREGAADELDLEGTIDGTARQGWLDVHMRPERHNAVKLLLFLDIGGSMDGHVHMCEELFSACRAEFKHLEHY